MNNLYYFFTQILTFLPIFLDILCITCVLFAISVITNKNPIVSILFLIGLFLLIAVYLIIVDIKFIGLAYLLVYVGAVSILFLFILMLINIRISELATETRNSIPLVFLVTLSFGSLSYIFLPEVESSFYTNKSSSKLLSLFVNWDNCLAESNDITSIGNVMYTNFGILLLLVSVILLLAMVGAIVINMKQTEEPSKFNGRSL